eukprot:1159491-Pelagomonas_calceolata.AAC.8
MCPGASKHGCSCTHEHNVDERVGLLIRLPQARQSSDDPHGNPHDKPFTAVIINMATHVAIHLTSRKLRN